jgi:hypothetical protein
MQIATVVKREDGELPPLEPDQTRLVVAADGIYRERHTEMFRSSTRVEPADLGLGEHYQYCQLHCGRIHRVMHRAMLSFFRHAHRLHDGEAALVLLYSPQQGRFRWHCPVQTVRMHWSLGRWVTSDLISFRNPTVLPEGYLHFGDAHLHAGSVTTPSLVDLRDDQDGLHIVVGNIDGLPRYHIDFVVDGKRFGVAPELIFDDPECLPFRHSPHRWLRRIRIERHVPYWHQASRSPLAHENLAADDRSDDRGQRNSGNGELQA